MSQSDYFHQAEKFIEALNSEDELGAVVRAHIHIEACLNQLLESQLTHPEHLSKVKLSYQQKVILALACGLDSKLSAPLNALGGLRNKFAHQLNTKLGKNELTAFYNSFDSGLKEDLQRVYQVAKKTRKLKGARSLSKANSRAQFSFTVSLLRDILILEKKYLTEGHYGQIEKEITPTHVEKSQERARDIQQHNKMVRNMVADKRKARNEFRRGIEEGTAKLEAEYQNQNRGKTGNK